MHNLIPEFPNSDQLTDEKIAKIVQSGEIECFCILVERYEEKIMRYARKFLFQCEDAEDLVQEVFLKAYVNIQSFDSARKFSPWLYRIAHNKFINEIKKKSKEPLPFFNFDILLPNLISKEDADKDLDQKELCQILKKCLNKLDPKYREPIVLYYFEELSYKDIADVLHIPVVTVGVRLRRSKIIMRSIYQKLGYDL